jgi:predicted outer membrane repeat protein
MQASNSKHLSGAFLVCILGWAVSVQSAVLTVDPQGSGFKTIQEAFSAAKDGDTIQLADGTYSGLKNPGLEFADRTLTLQSMNGPANCIVDCEGLGLSSDAKGTIRGITVVDGLMAIGAGGSLLTLEDCVFRGASHRGRCALYISDSRPTIMNCTFGNLSGDDGGAIHCEKASPVIRGCTFENNYAGQDGGAIHNRDASSPVITGCRFVGNSSKDDGGAIANFDESFPIIVACTFERNRSSDNGGAIFSRNGGGPRIVSCIFAGNDSRSHGGAIATRESTASIANCVFTGNVGHDNGGAVFYTQATEPPTLLNCTVVGNSAELQGGAVYAEQSGSPEMLNCILWANRDQAGQGETSQISTDGPPLFRYCCVQNWTGQWQGPANHGRDPLFVDADGPDNLVGTADDNLRLTANSPCLDAGFEAPLSEPFLTDGDGYPRLVGKATDMGAYEYATAEERAGVTPAYPQLDQDIVVINEALTHSRNTSDWLELHNVTDRTIHIGGWLLSDEHNPGLYEIAAGTVIEPHGYIVFYEDKHFANSADPGCRRPFALRNEGDALYLRSGYGGLPTGLRQKQYLENMQINGGILGRHTNSDGTVDFVHLNTGTPGAANAYPCVGPVVISEFMRHSTVNYTDWGYIELYNISDIPVTVTGYTLVSDSSWHEWTPSIDVPAKTRILITDNLSAMQSTYGPILPAGLRMLQGQLYVGALGYGSPLVLSTWYTTFERVYYRHEWVGGNPWPRGDLAAGRAVTRIDVTRYGNDPNNWQLADPSPGR